MKRRKDPEKTVLLIDQKRSKVLMGVVNRRARKLACPEEKKARNALFGLVMAILATIMELSGHLARGLKRGGDQDTADSLITISAWER
jgi:hypothetical protein